MHWEHSTLFKIKPWRNIFQFVAVYFLFYSKWRKRNISLLKKNSSEEFSQWSHSFYKRTGDLFEDKGRKCWRCWLKCISLKIWVKWVIPDIVQSTVLSSRSSSERGKHIQKYKNDLKCFTVDSHGGRCCFWRFFVIPETTNQISSCLLHK